MPAGVPLLTEYAFLAADTTKIAGPQDCRGFRRVVVGISVVENVDGRTITPEIQFNPLQDGSGAWSAGTGEMFYWNETEATPGMETAFTFAGTAILTSITQLYSVPVMGPLVRVNLVVTGAAGNMDVRVSIMGVS